MEKITTTGLTNKYIKEHPYIRHCIKKELINYSSLARLIAKELNIEKESSKEAILIAARRFRDKIKKELQNEIEVKEVLSKSELEIKNKIETIILEKSLDLDYIDKIQKKIRKEYGVFYLLEGSNSYTIIIQEKYSDFIKNKFKHMIIRNNKNLFLITLKTSQKIEQVRGIIAYLTSLFAENNVNIVEFFSCWVDTVFVIDSEDLNKTINFLKF